MTLQLILLLLVSHYNLQVVDILELHEHFNNEAVCLTQNVYFESRSESVSGQAAVGYVTLNRVHSSDYPNTICEVVKQDRQFSWYCDGKSDKMVDLEAKQRSYRIALGVLTKQYTNPIGNSTHYHNFSVFPHWATCLKLVTVIDNHIFYK